MISEHSDIWMLTLIKRNLEDVWSLYQPSIMIMIAQLAADKLGLSPSSVGNITP